MIIIRSLLWWGGVGWGGGGGRREEMKGNRGKGLKSNYPSPTLY